MVREVCPRLEQFEPNGNERSESVEENLWRWRQDHEERTTDQYTSPSGLVRDRVGIS